MTTIEQDIFGEYEFKIIAGIAVLWMIWHHLFTYPFYILPEIHYGSYFGSLSDKIIWQTSRIGNICVYIFAFSSGYSLYKNQHNNTFRVRIKRLFKFLRILWLLCFMVWVTSLLFGYGLPGIKDMTLSLFGIGNAGGFPTIGFSWYAAYYTFFVLVSPIICNSLRGGALRDTLIISLICCILFSYQYISGDNIYWFPLMSSVIGYLAAKNSWLNRLYIRLNWISTIYIFMLLFVVLTFQWGLCQAIDHGLGKQLLVLISMAEGIVALFFVLFTVVLIKSIRLSRVYAILLFIGELSTYLWFIHSIPFSAFQQLQSIVYYVTEPLIIFILFVCMMIPVALLIKKIISLVDSYHSKPQVKLQ